MLKDTPQGQTNHCPMCEDAAKRIEELERRNAMLVDVMKRGREELRACQAAIHLSGDFDPRYVRDAQAMMKQMDVATGADAAQSSAWLNKKHVEWLDSLDGKWCVMSLERGAGLFPVDYHLREPNKYIRIYAIPSDKD